MATPYPGMQGGSGGGQQDPRWQSWQPGQGFAGLGNNAAQRNPAIEQAMQQAWTNAAGNPNAQYALYNQNPGLFGNLQFRQFSGINNPWINAADYGNAAQNQDAGKFSGMLTPGVVSENTGMANGQATSIQPYIMGPNGQMVVNPAFTANANAGGPINPNAMNGGVPSPPMGGGGGAGNAQAYAGGNYAAGGGGGAQPAPSTLGQAAGGGSSGPGNYPAIPAGNIPLPSSQGGYGLNIGAYQNPMAGYMQDWANKALQSTYAGAGDLLSGPAMQGITDYNQKMALGNSYAPAAAMAAQQQGVGIGLDQYNQNMAFQQMLNQQGLNQYNQQFGYQQQLANQTIPFQQQMALAQLGLQGTQGAQGVTNLLATLLSQNALGAGQAAGAGTQGQSTAISQMIQSMLQNYLQQNLLNRIPALNQGTGQ